MHSTCSFKINDFIYKYRIFASETFLWAKFILDKETETPFNWTEFLRWSIMRNPANSYITHVHSSNDEDNGGGGDVKKIIIVIMITEYYSYIQKKAKH